MSNQAGIHILRMTDIVFIRGRRENDVEVVNHAGGFPFVGIKKAFQTGKPFK